MFGAVAYKVIVSHVARTFSFLRGPLRVAKTIFIALRHPDMYGFVVQLDGLIVTLK
jgi:hypothetical protein